MSALIVHVPHASTFIPDDVAEQFVLPRDELKKEARVSADLYTDVLARAAWPDAEILEAQVSRIVVDVERYADDALEDMASVGRGMIYRATHTGARLRRELGEHEKAALREKWYDPHWSRLRATANGKVFVDLHSYPATPWDIEQHPLAPRPEIDLGTSEGVTPPEWTVRIREHFERAGFEVGLNTPYAGVIDAGAKAAIMLEIRRDVIGEPKKGARWARLVTTMASMPLPRQIAAELPD